MGIVHKQSVLSTIISYTGVVIGFINVAFLFPKFFSAQELGLRSVLVEFSFIISQFALLGTGPLAGKYFSHFETKNNAHHNGFLFFISIIPFFGFIITSILFLIFKDALFVSYRESPLLSEYYFLILPFTLFTIYQIVFEVYIRSFLKIVFPGFVKEVLLRIFTSILVVLYIYKIISIEQFWYLFTASYGAGMLALILYTIKIGQFDFRPKFDFLKKSFLKEIFVFGLFGLFSAVAGVIVSKIDIVMITYMIDLDHTGIFALALYIISMVEIPRRSMTQIVTPLIASAWKDNNIGAIDDIYKKTSLNQLIIGGFIFMLLWLNIDYIFHLIPNSDTYIQGKYVIFFLGCAKVFDLATGANGEIIGFSRYFRFGLYSVLFLVICAVTTNFFFIPKYGITGAAMASAISIFVFNLIRYIFLLIKFRLQPFTSNTFWVLLLACITWISVFYLPQQNNNLLNITINSGLILILFLGPILIFRLSPDISTLFSKNINKIADFLPFLPKKNK
jgi:O-antigen/teichoic acid export membrane protein